MKNIGNQLIINIKHYLSTMHTWVSDVLYGGFSGPCTVVPSPAGPCGSPTSHRGTVVPSVTIKTLIVVDRP